MTAVASNLTVARVWGIPIQLHWSFLLVLPLFAYLMAQAYFAPDGDPTATDYVWGGLLAVALFASVVLHELGHSWTAQRYGVDIRSITLLPIGGVSNMERLPEEPGEELRVAAAGPLVSFAIGVPILLVSYAGVVPAAPPGLGRFVFWLGALNVFLGAFNLLVPAFPMDGGRVLRAALSKRVGRRKATEWAAAVGRGLAVFMGVLGLLAFGGGGWLLLLIAVFIYIGAGQEEQQVAAATTLGELRVADVMTREVRTVGPDDSVEDVFDAMVQTKHIAFPVVEGGGRVLGLVRLHEVAQVPQERHATTRVRDVLAGEVPRVEPGTRASEVLEMVSREERDRVVVEEAGRLVGLVTRTDLVRTVQILDAEEGHGADGRGLAS